MKVSPVRWLTPAWRVCPTWVTPRIQARSPAWAVIQAWARRTSAVFQASLVELERAAHLRLELSQRRAHPFRSVEDEKEFCSGSSLSAALAVSEGWRGPRERRSKE